jgi:hypothetical protein
MDRAAFTGSDPETVCPWKGVATYLTIVVDGERLNGVAWFYPKPGVAPLPQGLRRVPSADDRKELVRVVVITRRH